MADININEVYEELKYLGELPETSRLIKDYLALQDADASLRALVKELADALEERLCDYACEINGECLAGMKKEECESFNMRPLVARAREVAK